MLAVAAALLVQTEKLLQTEVISFAYSADYASYQSATNVAKAEVAFVMLLDEVSTAVWFAFAMSCSP